jgi:RecB family endonuclease NucS
MNWWVTTHWPPREDNPDEIADGLWVPEGREVAAEDVRKGDIVVVYQAKGGRTEVRRQPDGKELLVKNLKGKEGVIAITEAQSTLYALEGSTPEEYTDGSKIWWRWYTPLRLITRSGFVSRQGLNTILGYAPNYSLHGFGDAKSGLKKISQREFDQILIAFRENQPIPQEFPPKAHIPHDAPGGVESMEHRHLKEYVAGNPTYVLHEEGVRHLFTEYPFCTNDQADVVLEDKYGRIIGVEVEVAIDERNLAGMLQAIKYRYMLEVTHERSTGDSRALLIAYQISPGAKSACKKYNVEAVEVAKELVMKWVEDRTPKSS